MSDEPVMGELLEDDVKIHSEESATDCTTSRTEKWAELLMTALNSTSSDDMILPNMLRDWITQYSSSTEVTRYQKLIKELITRLGHVPDPLHWENIEDVVWSALNRHLRLLEAARSSDSISPECPECHYALDAVSYTHLTLPTNREV